MPVSFLNTLRSIMVSCVLVSQAAFSEGHEADFTYFPLKSVEFFDYKPEGTASWRIIYHFSDEDQGFMQITCYDEMATSKLFAPALFPNQVLEREGGDFYCFPFYALVEDLQDVTGGFQMPSFASGGTEYYAKYEFKANVSLPLKISDSSVEIFSRQTHQSLGSFKRVFFPPLPSEQTE